MEINFGVGGEDSKDFVSDLFASYLKYCENNNLNVEILDCSSGHVVCKINGKNAGLLFKNETGQHCVQRYPKTENNGRRHTSFVSVVVLPLPPESHYKDLPSNELSIKFQCGSGPGGQHRNKTASACRMVHLPTGLQVFINSGRDQSQNKKKALRILTAKVNEYKNDKSKTSYSSMKMSQMGTGNRGEKIRTYNFIECRVTDHRLGKKTSKIHDVMNGKFEWLK